MKHKALQCILCITLALCLLPLGATSIAAQPTTTIMLYFVGSDLESEDGRASADLSEIMAGNLSPNASVTVVAQTGGSSAWTMSGISSTTSQRHLVTADGLTTLENLGRQTMASANTLADFISWGYANYPADRMMLVLWDHGGGPVFGFGADELYDYDFMSLSTLSQALSSGIPAGKQLDILGFDACLMGSVEVASMVKPYAHYLLASEEEEPVDGWEYTTWITELVNNPAIDDTSLGKSIINAFVSANNAGRYSDSATLALIDLTRIPAVESAISALGIALDAALSSNVSGISRTRASLSSFGEYIGDDASDLVDIQCICDAFASYADTSTLLKATTDAVVYNGTTSDMTAYANGLSILMPYATIESDSSDYLDVYESFTALRGWETLVRSLTSTLAGSNYIFSAGAPTNIATASAYGYSGSILNDSTFASEYDYNDSEGGLWGGLYDNWYYDCDSYDTWYDSYTASDSASGLWDGLNSASSAGYTIPAGLWGGLSSPAASATAPATETAGLWDGLPTATPDTSSSGLWEGLDSSAQPPVSTSAPGVAGLWGGLSSPQSDAAPAVGLWAGLNDASAAATSSPDLSGLWNGLTQTGSDYYAPGDDNPNLSAGQSATDLTAMASSYFSASSLALQSVWGLQLTRDELDHLLSAEGVLLQGAGEDQVELGGLGLTRIDWSTGSVISLFDGSWPTLSGAMVTLYAGKDVAGLTRAVIPARVNGLEMYLVASLDESGAGGTILGATTGYYDNGMSVRGYLPLTDGVTVTLLHPYANERTDGLQWKDGASFTAGSEPLMLVWAPVRSGAYDYAFRLTDIYNQSQLTPAVTLTF